MEAKAGMWRWGRGGSEDRAWEGDVSWVRLREQPQSQAGRCGAGSGLQPPWGDALSPKGKQGAESFVSKSLLGGARASS